MIGIIYRRYWLLLVAILLSDLLGCGSLSKPYPDRNLYAISVADQPAAAKATTRSVLRVEGVHVAKPFDGATFVYKTGPSQFTTDYYAGFITTPESILSGELTSWLARSGLYSSVVSANSVADSRWSLESNVTALYGDYSASKPTAVVSIKFFLIDNADGHQRITFQKPYEETETLNSQTPSDLVEGWNKAYRRILVALVTDLTKTHQVMQASEGAAKEQR